jgi:hypothetical protein
VSVELEFPAALWEWRPVLVWQAQLPLPEPMAAVRLEKAKEP